MWSFLLENRIDNKFIYKRIFAMVCRIIYTLQDELHMSIEKSKTSEMLEIY